MWFWIVDAQAQENEIAALVDVQTLSAGTTCPDVLPEVTPGVVRLNFGLALAVGDGSYGYLCPARWGGTVNPDVAVAPDGASMRVVAEGALWRSDDGGCTFIAVPLAEGASARQVIAWRDAFWVLTRGTGVAEVLRESDGTLARIAGWNDFFPDGMLASGPADLWLAGATGGPQVRRLDLQGGIADSGPLPNLPAGDAEIDRIVPAAANGAEAWLRVHRRQSAWLWNASVIGTGPTAVVLFGDPGDRPRTLRGPVAFEGGWMALLDSVVHQAPAGAGTWVSTGETVPWSCLTTLGTRTFACDQNTLLFVDGLDEQSKARTFPVFSFEQLGGPELLCPNTTCDGDWEVWGGRIRADDIPAVCPDGRTAEDLDPSGCRCDQPGADGTGVALVGAMLLRRRRTTR